jgi:hypothetical protein
MDSTKMPTTFIRITNKAVRLDAISYVEFLESGRAMVVLSGLPPEKAHISVDVHETHALREYFESKEVTTNPAGNLRSPVEWPRPLPMRA